MTVGDSTHDVAYLRGGGVTTDGPRARRLALGFCCVALAALVAVLSVSAVREGRRADRLRDHGVPVRLTVTGCLGLASGTGATEYAYDCRGSFVLDGRRYDELLHGSTVQRRTGSVVAAVADPAHPSNVATAASVAGRHASASRWVPTGITVALLVIAGAVLGWPRRPSEPPLS
ncbi:hypothetical protein acdb102_01440 [Acidothermaceae bacterium B102]|nr:hypothetical protein acdb102_01440 [Acidothermaceae bacterium B102]